MNDTAHDDPRRLLGRFGERVAATMLESRGYRVVARNWRCRLGEIDLVAQRGDVLSFVEVRTRRSREAGSPEETITPRKRQRMLDLAYAYIQEHEQAGLPPEWQIALVAIELDERSVVRRVDFIDDVLG